MAASCVSCPTAPINTFRAWLKRPGSFVINWEPRPPRSSWHWTTLSLSCRYVASASVAILAQATAEAVQLLTMASGGRPILADAEAIFLITAVHGRLLRELSNRANQHCHAVT
mmetsp:Transcript_11204/g.8750  ORF Transcript_11204/g.8750 Transcript_11204/m.8750 type:complete len:113 (-) Transcript_11204:30-368(-)